MNVLGTAEALQMNKNTAWLVTSLDGLFNETR